MTIKTVHIKVVSDLTTNMFLAALNHFVSRRGLPINILLDNETNFKGALCITSLYFPNFKMFSFAPSHISRVH